MPFHLSTKVVCIGENDITGKIVSFENHLFQLYSLFQSHQTIDPRGGCSTAFNEKSFFTMVRVKVCVDREAPQLSKSGDRGGQYLGQLFVNAYPDVQA